MIPTFLNENEIIHETTTTYSFEMNGKAKKEKIK
jgi:hypothetical protein